MAGSASRRMFSKVTLDKLSSRPFTMGGRVRLDRFLEIDCKSGKFDIADAQFFFNEMLLMRPSPPISRFNILFGALAKRKHYSLALAVSFFKTLSSSGIPGLCSNLETLNILVHCYGRMKLGTSASSAFGLIFKSGHHPETYTFNWMIKGLLLEDKVADAARLLPGMIRVGCAPDAYTYSILIDILCKTGNAVSALQLHRELVYYNKVGEECYKPKTLSFALTDGSCVEWPIADVEQKDIRIPLSVVYFNCLIDGLCCSGMEEEATSVFLEMPDNGVHPNLATFTMLINFICKKGRVEQVLELLEMMKMPHLKSSLNSAGGLHHITYAKMIDCLCKNGYLDKAEDIFSEMQGSGAAPDIYVYTVLINGLCKNGHVGRAEVLFSDLKSSSVSPNVVTYNSLIDGLCKNSQVGKAKQLFAEMKSSDIAPNVVSYNSLIKGLYDTGKDEEAISLLKDMIGDGIFPDVVTFNAIIDNFCKRGDIEEARNLLRKMNKNGVQPNVVTYNCLINGLCIKGRMDDARDIVNLMQSHGCECNVVTYSTLVNGYSKAGMLEEAHNVLFEMETKGCSPYVITYSSLISGYCKAGRLEDAHKLFIEMKANGCPPNAVTYNSLISGYCKEGRLEDAHKLFIEMEVKGCSPDIITFNTLMDGFAREKQYGRVIELFHIMHEKNVLPNIGTKRILMPCVNKDTSCEDWVISLSDHTC